MTLYEISALMRDAEKLVKAESGEKISKKTETREQRIQRLRDMAKRHKGQKPKQLKLKNGKYVPMR